MIWSSTLLSVYSVLGTACGAYHSDTSSHGHGLEVSPRARVKISWGEAEVDGATALIHPEMPLIYHA